MGTNEVREDAMKEGGREVRGIGREGGREGWMEGRWMRGNEGECQIIKEIMYRILYS